MKTRDLLYGLDLIIFNHKRKEYDAEILEKLMDKNLIDWFSWYDEKKKRFLYKINATQKGLKFYIEKKNKSPYKLKAIICIIILLVPTIIIML